jgi:hypothetical protein
VNPRQRDSKRFFGFVLFTISFGLIDAPSSQRSTCCIVMACLVAGARTSMSSGVAGPMSSIDGSALNVHDRSHQADLLGVVSATTIPSRDVELAIDINARTRRTSSKLLRVVL